MSDNNKDQWYSNKDLFDMINDLKQQILRLCLQVEKLIDNMDKMSKVCDDVEKLKEKEASHEGEKKGGKDMYGYIAGFIGLLFGILNMVLK